MFEWKRDKRTQLWLWSEDSNGSEFVICAACNARWNHPLRMLRTEVITRHYIRSHSEIPWKCQDCEAVRRFFQGNLSLCGPDGGELSFPVLPGQPGSLSLRVNE